MTRNPNFSRVLYVVLCSRVVIKCRPECRWSSWLTLVSLLACTPIPVAGADAQGVATTSRAFTPVNASGAE